MAELTPDSAISRYADRQGSPKEGAAIIDVATLARDIANLSGVPFRKTARTIVREAAAQVHQFAYAFAPFKTGALRESIKVEFTDGGLGALIYPTVPYALFLEYGTGSRGEYPGSAYVIEPKRAEFLRFMVGGKVVFAKRVVHPGIAPRPFMRPAAERAAVELANNLASAAVSYIIKTPGTNLRPAA